MNSEQELNLVAGRIKRDAQLRGLDLSDPTHVFTVWADYPGLDRMVCCGSYATHSDAGTAAAEHAPSQNGKIYIAMGPLSIFGVYAV